MMTRGEELKRLIEDRDMLEMDLAYIDDEIRLGHLDEEDEWDTINALENEVMDLSRYIEELENEALS